jgi:hypothetical protein
VFQNSTATGEGEQGAEEKQVEDYSAILRTNPLQTPLLTEDMVIKGTNKPALVQHPVSI